MEDAELRDMVLAHAALKARECVEAVRPTSLHRGSIEDTINAGGVEWHITVSYFRDDDVVRVKGHPHRDDDEGGPELQAQAGGGPLHMLMFGMRPDQDAFEFLLPAAWLPASAPVMDAGPGTSGGGMGAS